MSDYFSIHDGMLRGMTFEDASLILRNVNPAEHPDRWAQMKKELRKWISDNVDDMFYELDQHRTEVWADAFPDEKQPLVNDSAFSSDALWGLKEAIYQFLKKNGLWSDVRIYTDGKCWATDDGDGRGVHVTPDCYLIEDIDPRDYFEYVHNPHILSMSFEGSLYECLNGYAGDYGGQMESEFSDLLAKYGLYYELGNAWNLSCYPI